MNSTKKLKYIITESGTPILFGEANQHDDFRHFNPTSAGWVQLGYNETSSRWEACCFGESTSLKLKADPDEDSRRIELLLNYY